MSGRKSAPVHPKHRDYKPPERVYPTWGIDAEECRECGTALPQPEGGGKVLYVTCTGCGERWGIEIRVGVFRGEP